jgi:hypothetical protein
MNINASHAVLLHVLIASTVFLNRGRCTSKKLGGRLMFIFGGSSPRYCAYSKILYITK